MQLLRAATVLLDNILDVLNEDGEPSTERDAAGERLLRASKVWQGPSPCTSAGWLPRFGGVGPMWWAKASCDDLAFS